MFLFSVYNITDVVYNNNDNNKITKDTVYINQTENTESLSIVRQDLITYNKYSNDVINDLVSNIDSASKKYNIPVGLLHSIFRIESEYRFWITHDPITVHGKRTNAIGLGGVVWEYWADSLKKYNIAKVKTDLYLYKNNIFATAAILRWIVNDLQRDSTTTKYNIISRLVKSYYGANSKRYKDKLIKVTSDLWLKRITISLINNKNK